MVKPDVRHNYYADLELPTNATLDDISKAYRKLAMQYHPDRNIGREEDCIPKFQAIQAANEVLGDATIKQRYDSDRRKAGLYPSFTAGSRSATPSGPYTATSAYPPPPRRTQAPTAQRPPQAAPPPNTSANGADRFSSFPRPASSRKDPAQDRTNAFKAWQNMQNTGNQERQQRPPQSNQPPPPNAPPQPQPNRQRPPPPPPPRADPKMAAEEPVRGGPRYKAPPPFDPEGADKRQSAWSAFQQTNAGKPGMPPGNTFNAQKQQFKPNAPPPPRPDDMGRGRPTVNVPPPRSTGPPPTTTSPETPVSPKTQRPRPDPMRPFKNRAQNDQIPFAEGNRVSTPYTKSYVGEKTATDFFSEGLRRSHSTRDTTKLSPGDGSNRARARSTSPRRGNQDNAPRDGQHDKFGMPSSGEESASDADMTQTPEEVNGATFPQEQRPGTAPNESTPFARPKKVPMPPSGRFNGTRSGPGTPQPSTNGASARAQSDGEQARKAEQAGQNMYAPPSTSSFSRSSSTFSSQDWTSQMFGSHSTSKAECGSSKIPQWAVPSSLNPVLRSDRRDDARHTKPDEKSFVTGADELFVNATRDEQQAFLRFQAELRSELGANSVPDNLDMNVFLKLTSMAHRSQPSGHAILDRILTRILLEFESVGHTKNNQADEHPHSNSFDYTHQYDPYTVDDTRHRSEENINTNFTPDGWTGTFTGEPDYFATPRANARKQPSPPRRPTPTTTNSQKEPTSHPRSSTMDEHHTNVPYEDIPQRPWGSDGTPSGSQRTTPAPSAGFDREGWERKFQDGTWTWPPPPPNPPSPDKGGSSSRKQSQSRKGSKPRRATGGKDQPYVFDDSGDGVGDGAERYVSREVPVDDGDAMDIDDTPPFHHWETQPDGTPNDHIRNTRTYSQPPSEWRQQQEQQQQQQQQGHHRTTSSGTRRTHRSATNGGSGSKFNANLDDLRDSLTQTTTRTEGLNLSDMQSSLPFQSQPSSTIYGDPLLPRDLKLPPLPKPPTEPQRLSKTSWHAYAANFAEYVRLFHEYNRTLLSHFETREQQAQALMTGSAGGGNMSWLEATGDTSGMLTAPTGFGTYMRGVKEDERVREGWVLAWERHREAVAVFQGVRDRVRRVVVGGGLVEN